MKVSHHGLQIGFEFCYPSSILSEITGLGLSKFQRSNSFPDFFFSKTLADIDLIFGMEVNHHDLQIEFEFRYVPLIFGQITGLET